MHFPHKPFFRLEETNLAMLSRGDCNNTTRKKVSSFILQTLENFIIKWSREIQTIDVYVIMNFPHKRV